MTKPCIVPKCKTGYKSVRAKRSVFKVPNDENMRKKWAASIPGISVLKPTQFVCEKHFHPDCVARKYVKHDDNGKLIAEVPFKRPYLITDAVPTIFIAEDGESNLANQPREVIDAEQKVLLAMEFDVDVKAGETTKSSIDHLSIDSVYSEASCIESFGDETDRKDIICSQSETSIENRSSMDPSVYRLQVLSTGCVGDESGSISLPGTWSVSKSTPKLGTEITFCRIITSTQNDIKRLIINKFFVIDNWTGRIQYYVHGKQICIDNTPLPHILQNASSLPVILATFERLRICQGAGFADSSLIKNDAFQDQSHSWHRNQCTLLTKNQKCDSCKTLKNTLRRRKYRAVNQSNMKRVSRMSDPLDQIKLNALRKKLEAQRRISNRAKIRIQMLNTTLEQKQAEAAALKLETLEEKCSSLEIPDMQKMAMKEIIAAANTSQKGRRYSEDWLMLCTLLNNRSPTYYEFLRKNNIIPLPCTRTIRNYYSLIDTKCGIDPNFAQLPRKHVAT